MYPTKGMYEYMNEMNRLFPRNTENDPHPNLNMSPFHQSTPVNKSSSSAESASSGSFPDMSCHSDRLRQANQSFDTPFVIRRQRPIVGRKIFDNIDRQLPRLEPMPIHLEEKFSNSIWQSDDHYNMFPNTPPNVLQQKNPLYELFPTEQRGFEFRTPVSPRSPEQRGFEFRTPVSPRSPASNYTASMGSSPLFSPTVSNSPQSAKICLPRMQTPPAFQNQPATAASCSGFDIRPTKMCTFCRKNGETPSVYMTHTVKEKIGSHNIVTCPILRAHVCSTCGASGDNAHTITYCPVLRSSNNGLPLQSTTITLKSTRIKSNGRRRY